MSQFLANRREDGRVDIAKETSLLSAITSREFGERWKLFSRKTPSKVTRVFSGTPLLSIRTSESWKPPTAVRGRPT